MHRYEVLINRRKGERLVQLDWHPLATADRAAAVRLGPRARARYASSATTSSI